MSSRIEHILEVLGDVARECEHMDGVSRGDVSDLRLKAVEKVAKRRDITCRTVADAYIRQLRPEVPNTEVFDGLVQEWLQTGSTRLQHVLRRHAVDFADEKRINRFFEQSRNYVSVRGEAPAEPRAAEKVRSQAIEMALRFEREQGRKPDDVSEEQYGFNIRSLQFDSDGTLQGIRYIDIKAVIPSEDIKISVDEWAKASSFGDDFWLYLVTSAGSKELQLWRIQNPAAQFRLGEDILPTGYVIRKDAWRKFAEEE